MKEVLTNTKYIEIICYTISDLGKIKLENNDKRNYNYTNPQQLNTFERSVAH
jgi:hypothetical protein